MTDSSESLECGRCGAGINEEYGEYYVIEDQDVGKYAKGETARIIREDTEGFGREWTGFKEEDIGVICNDCSYVLANKRSEPKKANSDKPHASGEDMPTAAEFYPKAYMYEVWKEHSDELKEIAPMDKGLKTEVSPLPPWKNYESDEWKNCIPLFEAPKVEPRNEKFESTTLGWVRRKDAEKYYRNKWTDGFKDGSETERERVLELIDQRIEEKEKHEQLPDREGVRVLKELRQEVETSNE